MQTVITKNVIDPVTGDEYDVQPNGTLVLGKAKEYNIKYMFDNKYRLEYKNNNPIYDVYNQQIIFQYNHKNNNVLGSSGQVTPNRDGININSQIKGVKYGTFQSARISFNDIITQQA